MSLQEANCKVQGPDRRGTMTYVRVRGRNFEVDELVWVHSPQRTKGRCPKLDNEWVGPCRVLERLEPFI